MCAVLLKEQDGYYYMESELLKEHGIRHFFSTIRHDKLNHPINFGFHYGEEREAILSHYRIAGEILGEPIENMVKSTQIHEAEIHDVDASDMGKGILRETDLDNADGLICGKKHIPLVIFTADCVPILFSDKEKHVSCAVHAGWRGSVKEIAAKAVKKMHEEYRVPKENILCAIGPCISKCCFEVSREVVEAFEAVLPATDFVEGKDNGKYHIDLKGVNKALLMRVGILEENIDVADACTYCEKELFYSYRRQGNSAGRMAAFIVNS